MIEGESFLEEQGDLGGEKVIPEGNGLGAQHRDIERVIAKRIREEGMTPALDRRTKAGIDQAARRNFARPNPHERTGR